MKSQIAKVIVIMFYFQIISLAYNGGTEVIEERNFFGRTWLTDTGEYVTEIYIQPVCYKDQNNEWQIIAPGDTATINIALDQYRTITPIYSSEYGYLSWQLDNMYMDPTICVQCTPRVGNIYHLTTNYECRGFIEMDLGAALPDWDINITNFSIELGITNVIGNGVNTLHSRIKSEPMPRNSTGALLANWEWLGEGGLMLPELSNVNAQITLIVNDIIEIRNLLQLVWDDVNNNLFTFGFTGDYNQDSDNYIELENGTATQPVLTITWEKITRPLVLFNKYVGDWNLENTKINIRQGTGGTWSQIISGDYTDVFCGDNYQEHPEYQKYPFYNNIVQHHHWINSDNPNDTLTFGLKRSFTMERQGSETAMFDYVVPVSFSDNLGIGDLIELRDFWRVTSGTNQSYDWFVPNNGVWDIFVNQRYSVYPWYSIRTNSNVEYGGFSYDFVGWEGHANFESNNSYSTRFNISVPAPPQRYILANYEAVTSQVAVSNTNQCIK